ncbi:MAG TPA: hypothetical protein VM487_02180 [Phycisphaerae bacterium]|nr:hypothetical protein [Phycisphaerae bacterium]
MQGCRKDTLDHRTTLVYNAAGRRIALVDANDHRHTFQSLRMNCLECD